MEPGRPVDGTGWARRPLWEFPGGCPVTGMECVGKPLRAGLTPAQVPTGEGRGRLGEWVGVCASISVRDPGFTESGGQGRWAVSPSFLRRVVTRVISGLETGEQAPELPLGRRGVSSDACGKGSEPSPPRPRPTARGVSLPPPPPRAQTKSEAPRSPLPHFRECAPVHGTC